MENIKRRDIQPSWNINEPDAPSIPQGVTTAKNISRCTDITIMRINEESVGSCDFATGQVCMAESVYKVDAFNAKNGITYKWEIVSGNASFTVDPAGHPIDDLEIANVRSTGDTDTLIELKCTVTDGDGNQVAKTEHFTHARTQV